MMRPDITFTFQRNKRQKSIINLTSCIRFPKGIVHTNRNVNLTVKISGDPTLVFPSYGILLLTGVESKRDICMPKKLTN